MLLSQGPALSLTPQSPLMSSVLLVENLSQTLHLASVCAALSSGNSRGGSKVRVLGESAVLVLVVPYAWGSGIQI